MQLYRYSPIQTEENLQKTIAYVAEASSALCKKVVGEALPITSLTVFAHYEAEFEFLSKLLLTMGDYVGSTNGPRVALRTPIVVSGHTITHLRIREPDPYRAQVGCNDFDVADYGAFKHTHLVPAQKNLRLIVRPEYELIEFFDPDFDVLAYVLSDAPRSKK